LFQVGWAARELGSQEAWKAVFQRIPAAGNSLVTGSGNRIEMRSGGRNSQPAKVPAFQVCGGMREATSNGTVQVVVEPCSRNACIAREPEEGVLRPKVLLQTAGNWTYGGWSQCVASGGSAVIPLSSKLRGTQLTSAVGLKLEAPFIDKRPDSHGPGRNYGSEVGRSKPMYV